MSQHSAACCSVPPVVSKGYKEKGEYITVDGLKTYATGPSTAKRGILVVYDIFGFWPQTLQGADILAFSDKEHHQKVFIPDVLDGEYAEQSWVPPDTKEKGEKLGNFFKTVAAPPKAVEKIKSVQATLAKENPDIKNWGLLGYCWGGKVTALSSQEGTPYKAAAAAHPAMVDPEDGPKITVPFLMLPSKDEEKDAVDKWQQALKVKGVVEWFPDQVHGWMAARGDLEQDKVRSEYERGYKLVLDFFHEHL